MATFEAMNVDVIDKAFQQMINEKGIEAKLGVERNYVYQLRNKVKNNIGITTDTKLDLLKKSGWKESSARYTREDLIDAIRFTLKQGAKAKEFGAEYLAEKWEAGK